MGTTKKEAYSKEQNDLAILIKALAHPARLAILEYLVKLNGCVCKDIVDELNIAQATVSQHLKELKSAGIIKGETEGRNVCYCIDVQKLLSLKNQLDLFFSKVKDRSCC